MSEEVAASIPGSRYTLMKGMGHFPMVEDCPGLKRYLMPELQGMLA